MEKKPYSIVKLVQGTRAWLKWRSGGIGASDAPAIMGESPWKSSERLFREKTGRIVWGRTSEVMRRGTELEPEARSAYVRESGMRVDPACLQSMSLDWQRASLDGLSADGLAAVEIKCGEAVYRETEKTRKVPKHYLGQLQHIMAVTGLPAMHFWCYLPGRKGLLLEVQRDDRYIDLLLRMEADFWKRVIAEPCDRAPGG